MEATKPKSRRELYNEKLKERDLYGNGFIERFTENGAGAPLRDNEGKIITKRRTMLNNDYEDIFLSQRNRTPYAINNNINQQMNFSQTNSNINNNNNDINNNYLNNNNNFYRTLSNKNVDLNNLLFNDNNNYDINNNNVNENENIVNNNFHMTNLQRRPQSQINQINFNDTLNTIQDNNQNTNNRIYNNINNNAIEQENNLQRDPFGNNYQGTGILPRDRTSETDKRYQNQALREAWLKEIEDKKKREAQRKQEQNELDLKYEAKYLKERQELEENEKLKELQKKEQEQETRNINSQLIENKNKMQNQNDIQNNMVMNGNNLEPNILSQDQEEYNPQQQNFRILRNTNNLNVNMTNNYDEMQINQFGFDYSNPRELEENINEQIAKLRNDVNSQYIEMSNLFGKLKMDVIEANQLKNEAEKELQYIKRELHKNKMASLAYDAELNNVLERHAPYNNMHINIKDVDPLYSLKNSRKDLQSSSNMIYATDMVNEQNVNRVKQLSALAQAGQNLVGLKAESEFIPINNPGDNNDLNNEGNNYGNEINTDPKNNIAISQTGYKNLESESYHIFQQNNDNTFAKDNMDPKILEDYTNKGEYANMYKDLGDIAKINSDMGSESKLRTLSKNYELDYNSFKEKNMEEQKRNINQFNQLLDEIQ